MKSRRILGLIVLALLVGAGGSLAGLPCAAYSSAEMAIQRVVGNGLPCGTCDLVWCPAGDLDLLLFRVTVRDCEAAPVPSCELRLDLSGEFDGNDELPATNNGRICGTPSRTGTTDESGAVAFVISGGGAGRFAIHWVVTALCADPAIELAENDDTLCIKSVAFRGNGIVNFGDTFQLTPQLSAGHGYSADFRLCSTSNTVNFMDTFVYMPHISYFHMCPGGQLQSFLLTKPAGGIPPDCDVIF